MGAWGSGSFENDSAGDWSYELEDGDASTVRAALNQALGDEELEVDEASAVVAAAEIVAAALGKPGANLPEEVTDFLAKNGVSITAADGKLARQALERVVAKSELQALWDENGPNNEWRPVMADLLARLP
jgi:hypothetical protein